MQKTINYNDDIDLVLICPRDVEGVGGSDDAFGDDAFGELLNGVFLPCDVEEVGNSDDEFVDLDGVFLPPLALVVLSFLWPKPVKENLISSYLVYYVM